MSNEDPTEKGTQTWELISATMIGGTFTVLALLWELGSSDGLVVISYLLPISLLIYANSLTANAKIQYERRRNASQEVLDRWERLAAYSFGLAFTLTIVVIAILAYSHLKASVGGLIALLCPIIILAVAWVLMAVYTITEHPEQRRRFLNRKRITWLVVEAVGLVLIILDYLGIVSIL